MKDNKELVWAPHGRRRRSMAGSLSRVVQYSHCNMAGAVSIAHPRAALRCESVQRTHMLFSLSARAQRVAQMPTASRFPLAMYSARWLSGGADSLQLTVPVVGDIPIRRPCSTPASGLRRKAASGSFR